MIHIAGIFALHSWQEIRKRLFASMVNIPVQIVEVLVMGSLLSRVFLAGFQLGEENFDGYEGDHGDAKLSRLALI